MRIFSVYLEYNSLILLQTKYFKNFVQVPLSRCTVHRTSNVILCTLNSTANMINNHIIASTRVHPRLLNDTFNREYKRLMISIRVLKQSWYWSLPPNHLTLNFVLTYHWVRSPHHPTMVNGTRATMAALLPDLVEAIQLDRSII